MKNRNVAEPRLQCKRTTLYIWTSYAMAARWPTSGAADSSASSATTTTSAKSAAPKVRWRNSLAILKWCGVSWVIIRDKEGLNVGKNIIWGIDRNSFLGRSSPLGLLSLENSLSFNSTNHVLKSWKWALRAEKKLNLQECTMSTRWCAFRTRRRLRFLGECPLEDRLDSWGRPWGTLDWVDWTRPRRTIVRQTRTSSSSSLDWSTSTTWERISPKSSCPIVSLKDFIRLLGVIEYKDVDMN